MKKILFILLTMVMILSCGSNVGGKKDGETPVDKNLELKYKIDNILSAHDYTYKNDSKEYKLSVKKDVYDTFNEETFNATNEKEITFTGNEEQKEYNISGIFKVIIKNSDFKKVKVSDGKHRLAIVIDDVGYHGPEIAEKFNSLDMPMTFAILPFVQHNREGRAVLEEQEQHEIILHLPLESTSKSLNQGTPGLITVNMTREQMKESIEKSIADVGGVKGFNNHIGSIFTGDQHAVDNLISIVKELDLFYLDSNVIPHSKGYPTAKANGVKTALNGFFVDNKADVEYIKSYIKQGIEIAKTREETVIIGHYRPKTIQAFLELKQYIKDSGVELVILSDVLQ